MSCAYARVCVAQPIVDLHFCRCTMLTSTKYCIKPLSTIYINSDAMPVDSFPKFNTARVSSAQCKSPAWWWAIHTIKRRCGWYGIPNSRGWIHNQMSSSMKRVMHTCHVSIEAMRSTCLDYQKIRKMSKRQIPEMSLSEILNLRRLVVNLRRLVVNLHWLVVNLRRLVLNRWR